MKETIALINPTVGRAEINEFLQIFKKINIDKTAVSEIIFEATRNNVIIEFDLLLVGCMILLKEEYSDINIVVKLAYNPDQGKEGSRVYRKLTQASVFAYLLTGKQVFRLIYGKYEFDTNFNDLAEFRDNSYVLSDSFMLFLFIAKERTLLYDTLFTSKNQYIDENGSIPILEQIDWVKENDTLLSICNSEIKKSVTPGDKNRRDSILRLGLMAFVKTLYEIHILNIYLVKDKLELNKKELEKLKVSNLSSRLEEKERIYDNWDYFKEIEPIVNELSDKPLVYQFIFSTLVSSKLLPSPLGHGEREDFVMQLHHLWHFTKELVLGLQELAKNIKEHSSTHRGIILANMVRASDTTPEKGVVDAVAYLNIHILDLGNKGIVPTTYTNTEALLNNPVIEDEAKSMLNYDLVGINNKIFKLPDFFFGNKILNQQAKKSIAHLGILLFRELIESNKGSLVITSDDDEGEREIAHSHIKLSADVSPLIYGTHYDVVLPIVVNRTYLPHLSMEMPVVSSEEIQSIEKLVGYKVVNVNVGINEERDMDQKTICSVLLPEIQMNEKTSEFSLWQTFFKHTESLSKMKAFSRLIHINMDHITGINASQLFRFLGVCESKYPSATLIISHLKNQVLDELIRILIAYYKAMPGYDFWNGKVPAILLTYEVDNTTGRRFYFTDVLWGKQPGDFLLLNELVGLTQFNSVRLMENEQLKNFYFENIEPMPESPLFINNNVLLSVDLLINHDNQQTIFENNAAFLLDTELMPHD